MALPFRALPHLQTCKFCPASTLARHGQHMHEQSLAGLDFIAFLEDSVLPPVSKVCKIVQASHMVSQAS